MSDAHVGRSWLPRLHAKSRHVNLQEMHNDSMDVALGQLIEVCRFLPNFLDKGTWKPAR
jgi:hypothetical protein